MRRSVLLLLLACLCSAPALQAVEVIKIRPPKRSDGELEEEVRKVLEGRPGFDARGITVEVKEGRLRLSGTVADLHASSEVERHASSVRGLRAIDNAIRVDPVEIPDSLLQLNAMRALEASPRLRAFDLKVAVADAGLTITGEVPLARDRLEAEKLVSRVRGIQRLENRLRIAPAPVDPAVVQRRLERLLSDKMIFGGVDQLEIGVSDSGRVTLDGIAATHVDRLRAERIAYGLRGVTEVVNRIRVRAADDGSP